MICSNGHFSRRLGASICVWVTLGDWKEPKLAPKCMGESNSNQRCVKAKSRESQHTKRKLQIVKFKVHLCGWNNDHCHRLSTSNCLKTQFPSKQ